MKTVGEILKECIKKNGHTLEEEAKEIGVSQSLLSDVINGKREIRSESLRRICTHFNISADYLLGLSDTPSVDPDIKMICEFTGLSKEVVEKLHLISRKVEEGMGDEDYPIPHDYLIKMQNNHWRAIIGELPSARSMRRSRRETVNAFILSSEFSSIIDAINELKNSRNKIEEINHSSEALCSRLKESSVKDKQEYYDFETECDALVCEINELLKDRNSVSYEIIEHTTELLKRLSGMANSEIDSVVSKIENIKYAMLSRIGVKLHQEGKFTEETDDAEEK